MRSFQLLAGIILLQVAAVTGAPLTTHPRLWVTGSDVPRLRSWAVTTNTVYQNGLRAMAVEAKSEMDNGNVPGLDNGGTTYSSYPTESYAMLFAFMSLIENNPVTRDDYTSRARTLLMYVMDRAALGNAGGQPFRDPNFSVYDRSRWHGHAFALTVDWIYPALSAADKTKIRGVFQQWINQNLNAYGHPQPIGTAGNSPTLHANPSDRYALNNYYTAHMRNIGLMSMALDAADDPGDSVRGYLANTTGAWLYLHDKELTKWCKGGLAPEGFLYGPSNAGRVAMLMLALRTSGNDDPALYTPVQPQVQWANNQFWNDVFTASIHSLSPSPLTLSHLSWRAPMYNPAYYGDANNYEPAETIGLLAPIALYDESVANTTRLNGIRWFQRNMAPGGPTELLDRVDNSEDMTDGILYFMLMDPTAPTPSDPRPALPLTFFSEGLNRLLSRTSWQPDAAWFTYKLSWNDIDHNHANGNQFEFWRKGEWLTKEWSGYGSNNVVSGSDYHNTLALQNTNPGYSAGDYRQVNYQHGSQYYLISSGDPVLLAKSFTATYDYLTGDATKLYNATGSPTPSVDILHASRSIFWLKPDHIFIYDRARSQTAGRYKRFWMNLPATPTITGTQARMVKASGQQLFSTTLLPAGATLSVDTSDPVGNSGDETAGGETMTCRLKVEATGGPTETRFLHMLQGANTGVPADAVSLVQSTAGQNYAGAATSSTVVLFAFDGNTSFTGTSYSVPAAVTRHYITGVVPNATYLVTASPAGPNINITVTPGAGTQADSGGVLVWTQPVAGTRDWMMY